MKKLKSTLIFGPPGTGKTTKLLDLISESVAEGGDPSSIYFLSYTKAAAQEALRRVGLKKSKNFCTLHSLCYAIGGISRASVMTPPKYRDLTELTGVPIVGDSLANEKELTDGEAYLQIISKAVNTFHNYADAYESSDRPGTHDEFVMFANTYDKWRKACGFVDFNDMLLAVLHKSITFNPVKIIIDEGQDMTPLQWAVIDKLIDVGNPRELIVAGDDDQCLYSWGGAHAHAMDDFGNKYGASSVVLSKSWRIPQTVHRLANSVINRVSRRVDKQYDPRDFVGEVSYFTNIACADINPYEDVMIMARTHSLLENVEDTLKDRCIPYIKAGGVSPYTNRFALSIRGILKTNRGELMGDDEYRALLGTVKDAELARRIECGAFSEIRGVDWRDVVDVPPQYMHYYESVDMEREPTVVVSTIHAAKGKEAERVILLTDQTPRVMESMNTISGADDEHRCMYVGVTRTKSRLDVILNDEGYKL